MLLISRKSIIEEKSSELQEINYFDDVEESNMIYETEEGNDLNYGFGYFNDIDENQKITVEFDYDDHDDSEEKNMGRL